MRLFEDLGIRADVDHRRGNGLLNQSARFYAIHRSPQLEVQQNQIRPKLTRSLHRFFARIYDRYDSIAQQDYGVAKILRDERLIFHDQNASFLQM